MWPYTDEEADWLETRKADIAAGRPVRPDPALVAYYVREGRRMRAVAIAQMAHMIARSIAGALRRPVELPTPHRGPLPTS